MTDHYSNPPVLGFAAHSGTGKTTLLVKILPLLRATGIHVGMIKHAHHQFEIDTPGKDSYELRKAGAEQMLVASDQRWALMHDYDQPEEPRLEELLRILPRDQLDLILVEGFHKAPFPKIELHRPATGKPLLFPGDPFILAVASDAPVTTSLPVLDINSPQEITAFIIAYLQSST